MKIFLTGATGYVGNRLAARLAEEGHTIHALCRSKKKAEDLRYASIQVFEGDVTDPASIDKAIKGCDLAIHTAAFAAVWPKYEGLYEEINIGGTENIVKACIQHQVKRLIYTSTAGVLGPSTGEEVNEKSKRTVDFFNAYERTKSIAENLVLQHAGDELHTCVLNLTRVYGPGLLTETNATTRLMQLVARSEWRVIPGDGSKYGNYVFIDDVIEAHIQAMSKAGNGEKYIIGGDNLSFKDFFTKVRNLSGSQQKFIHIPVPLIMFSSHVMELGAKWFGITPKITPSWARRYMYDWKLSSEKAKNELGFKPSPFDKATLTTIQWLKANNEI